MHAARANPKAIDVDAAYDHPTRLRRRHFGKFKSHANTFAETIFVAIDAGVDLLPDYGASRRAVSWYREDGLLPWCRETP